MLLDKIKKLSVKRWVKFLIGTILLPVFFVTYMIDRFIMVFLVHMDAPDIVTYFKDINYIAVSCLRNITLLLIMYLIKIYFM